ncbi:MAG: YcfL family protein [Kiritimatiellia bacterium]
MVRRVFVSGLVAAAVAGCVSYHTPPMDRRVTVAPDLGTAVWVTDVRLTRTGSQQLTLQANVVNNTDAVVRMAYRTVWLDAAGAEIPSAVSTWLPISAAPREVVGLKSTAPAPNAVDFRFYVQAGQ